MRRDRRQELDPEERYREAVAAHIASLLELPGLRRVDAVHREIAREIIYVVRQSDPIIQAARDVAMHRTMPSRYIVRLGETFLAALKK